MNAIIQYFVKVELGKVMRKFSEIYVGEGNFSEFMLSYRKQIFARLNKMCYIILRITYYFMEEAYHMKPAQKNAPLDKRRKTVFVGNLISVIKTTRDASSVEQYITSNQRGIDSVPSTFNETYKGKMQGVTACTPFQMACRINSLPIVQLLMRLGGNPDASCLRDAFENGNVELVGALVAAPGTQLNPRHYEYALHNRT